MKTLFLESPAVLLSPIGPSVDFWPQECLVCLTVDTNHISAAVRL